MKKRGISAIVATVFIILIAVSSISIFWIGVLPLIQDRIELEAACQQAEQTISFESACVGATKEAIYDAVWDGIYVDGDINWEPGKSPTDVGELDPIDGAALQAMIEDETIFVSYNLTEANSVITSTIEIQVKRKVSSYELADLQFGAFWKGFQEGNSDTGYLLGNGFKDENGVLLSLDNLPSENEVKEMIFQVHLGTSLFAIDAFIAPVIEVNGKQKLCNPTPTTDIDICPDAVSEFS